MLAIPRLTDSALLTRSRLPISAAARVNVRMAASYTMTTGLVPLAVMMDVFLYADNRLLE